MLELDRLADGLASLRPVRIDPGRCLPRLSPRVSCRACETVCPDGAIHPGDGLQTERCAGCGLCAAVCQADAIGLDDPSDQELLQRFAALARRSSCLPLACLEARPAAGSTQVGCLGRLTPELLLAAAACGFEEIQLTPAECTGCRYASGEALWQESLATAQQVLRALHHPCRLRQTSSPRRSSRSKRPAGSATAPPVYEERRAFLLAALGLLRELLPLDPGPAAPAQQLSRRREMLRWALEQLGTKGLDSLPWGAAAIRLTGLCHGCAICETLCPNGAIHLTNSGLELDPGLCHTCGLCARVCPSQALLPGLPRPLAALAGPPESLGRRTTCQCSRCGEPLECIGSPGEAPLCLPCSLRPHLPQREGCIA